MCQHCGDVSQEKISTFEKNCMLSFSKNLINLSVINYHSSQQQINCSFNTNIHTMRAKLSNKFQAYKIQHQMNILVINYDT
jgi:plasmid replication initiation protein